MWRVGLGYRQELATWLATRPDGIQCLEIVAEHFFPEGRERLLHDLRRVYPLMVHGLGISLGTPGPLVEEDVRRFERVVAEADPLWISEHVAFTRTSEVDLGHLNPVVPSRESLRVLAEHAMELSGRCRKRLLLENITSHVRLEGEWSEPEFLNRLCEASGCGLLLDVTNLYVNGRNHGFDPRDWLRDLDVRRIVQLHVVGYTERDGRWHDEHAEAIQEDLMDLIHEVLRRAPVEAVVLERDERFPGPGVLRNELLSMAAVHA